MEDVADEAHGSRVPNLTDDAPTPTTSKASPPHNLGNSSEVADTCEAFEHFMGLCRTCGKPNSQLHELFPESPDAAPESATNAADDTSLGATRCPKAGRRKVTVPAKATAQCQIDIDSILVEMEIWDLRIRANDGLPYRICPQCVRQFYIISKFRSKCIKVQQRLRSYFPEGPAAMQVEEAKVAADVVPALDVGNNFINSTDEPEATSFEAAPRNADDVAPSLLGSSMEVESTPVAVVVEESPLPTHINAPPPINYNQIPAKIMQKDERHEASLDEATSIPEQDLRESTGVEQKSLALQKDQEEQPEDLNKFLQAGRKHLGLVRSFSYTHSPLLSPESPSFVTKAALKAYATPLHDASLKCTLRTHRKRSYSAEAFKETARENKSSKQVDGRISADLSPNCHDMSPLRENRLDTENRSYAVRQVYNCVVVLERLKEDRSPRDEMKQVKVKDAAENFIASVPPAASTFARHQHPQTLSNNEVGPRSPWRTKAEMKGNALLGTEATVGQQPKRKRHRRNQCELMITASANRAPTSRMRTRRNLDEQPSENSSEVSISESKRLRTLESETSRVGDPASPTTSSETQELIVRVPLTALTEEFQKHHFPNPSSIDAADQSTGPSTPAESATPSKDKNFYKSALADCSEAAGALNSQTGVRALLPTEGGDGMRMSICKESEQQVESEYAMPSSPKVENLTKEPSKELRLDQHDSKEDEENKSRRITAEPTATNYHPCEEPPTLVKTGNQGAFRWIELSACDIPDGQLLPASKNDTPESDSNVVVHNQSKHLAETFAVENSAEMLKLQPREPADPDYLIHPTNTMDSPMESENSLPEEPSPSSETSFTSSQSSSPLKMNGFLNAFQKYCAETREKEQNNDLAKGAEVLPSAAMTEAQASRHMPSLSESNLSEMNDVETTLNGILNEMQDTHIFTPVSSHTDDFFNPSVYSPLSDQPETPANSMYADSPISGCISVESSPYMLQKHTPGPPDARPDAKQDVFNSFSNYNECFTEDSTQSELIGFQNNIPCFENIELVSANVSSSPTASSQEPTKVQYVDGANIEPSNTPDNAALQLTQLLNELQQPQQSQVVEIQADNGTQSVTNHEPMITNDFVLTKDLAATQANMMHINSMNNIPSSNMVQSNILAHPQASNMVHSNILVNTQTPNVVHNNMLANPQTNTPKMQYITLSSSPPTPQPCLMAQHEPNANQLNDLQQMATFQAVNIADNGQINLYTGPANQQELQWSANAGAITAIDAQNNSTTTYYVNANDLYQSNLISTTGSALDSAQISAFLAQQQPQIELEKRPMDANENYIEGMQNQPIMIVIPQEFLRTADPAQQTYIASNELNTLTVTSQAPQTVLLQPNAINASNHKPTPHYITPLPMSSPVSQQQIFTPPPPQQPPQPPTPKPAYHHQRSPDQKVNLTCRFCHKGPKFTNNLDYSNHIIAFHPSETPYNCPHCPLQFTKRARRAQHIVEEHGPRSFQCAQCGENFCAQRTLDLHLQRYHAPEPSQQQQHSSVQQPSRYLPHQQPAHPPQQQQQLQHQRWLDGGHQQQSSLVRVEDVHLHVSAEQKGKKSIDLQLDANQPLANEASSTLHAAGNKHQRILCCPDCDDNFEDQTTGGETHPARDTQHHHSQAHSSHVTPAHVTMPSPEQIEPDSTTTLRQFRKRSANSPTISSNSNYSASSPNSPTSAANVAAEQLLAEQSLRTSHNCLFCDGRFTNEIALRKHHQMAHSNQATVMPFICKVCNRGFRMNTLLQRHMETHDSEGRPYECNLCQIRFPRPSQLTLHKLTVHFLKKPLTCHDCDKQFDSESLLNTHIKFAHGERNFECDICGRQFFVVKDLRKHRRIHSGGRFYKCKFCPSSYLHYTRFSAHMKSHHIPQSPAFVEDGTTKITESALTIQQNDDENLEETLLAEELPEEPFESVDVQEGPMTPTP